MSDSNAPSADAAATAPTLARTMGLGALVIYGVGDMLGSGVYALIGKVAGAMGNAIWVAFLASMVAAMLTGLSYASLGSRYPRAAGVAYITHRAFHLPFLSFLLGLAVVASGLTSFATQSRAFSGYLLGLLGQPNAEPGQGAGILIVLGFILVLTFINFWGMREATWLNILCTTVEVTGLLIVIAVGMRYWGGVDYLEVPPPSGQAGAVGALTAGLVLQGAVLTFYSFIGFEDMINVTEEVKDPRRNFPRAVMLALAITTVIYMAVSFSAISAVPHQELAASGQPLVEVVKRAAPAFPSALFSFIALFAITNTGLLNYIMGSRMVYGMARQGFVPRILGSVHHARRTPHVAILLLMVIVGFLAFYGNIRQLASATSVLLLTVFIVVNASLVILQRRPGEPKGAFEIPAFVPIGGILVCLTMLFHADRVALGIAAALLAGITLLYLIARPKNISEETLAEAAEEV
jgi:amino acid transporter